MPRLIKSTNLYNVIEIKQIYDNDKFLINASSQNIKKCGLSGSWTQHYDVSLSADELSCWKPQIFYLINVIF